MNDWMRELLALPEQASALAREIDGLHYFVITVTFVGWAVITLAGTYFVIRYRRRRVAKPPSVVRTALGVEVGITAGLLAIFLVWWLIGYRQFVRVQAVPSNAMEVYVTGKQWMWKFAYPDGPSSIGVLTVPTGRPIKLLMTSRDVIHSFYVPAFRIKQDVLPGRYTTTWFQADRPGTHQILCTEYCGLLHSNMWGSVVALAPEDFDRWRAQAAPGEVLSGVGELAPPEAGTMLAEPPVVQASAGGRAEPSMVERGREVSARYGCLGCHTIDGRAHLGPSWAGMFASVRPLADGTTVIADEAYITRSMMDPFAQLTVGFAPVMPSYQGLMEPGEVGAVIEYIKSLRRNAPAPVIPPMGGMVTDRPIQ